MSDPGHHLQIQQHRRPLVRTRQALAAGRVTVGYIGGSITDQRPGHNWPEPVSAWFAERFPDARIMVENAAIGATGSQLGAFRAQRDLLDRGCDLVFVEYAVNDAGLETEARMRSREGLLRQLLAAGIDVVLVYTFSHVMYDDMIAGRVPATVAELEQLGEHYGLGSVWMGLHAMREVQAGRMRWEEWLPDGLHPQSRGSLSYGQSVVAYLDRELSGPTPTEPSVALSAPMNARHWQLARRIAHAQIACTGPWLERRSTNLTWVDTVLTTSSPGATLSWEARGHTLVVALDFGKSAADFRFRLDGGEWQDVKLERPDWSGPSGWLRLHVLAADLADTTHAVELEVMHPGVAPGAGPNMRLIFAGVIE